MSETRSPRSLTCLFCGKGYFTFNSLAYHVSHAHRTPDRPVIRAVPSILKVSPMAKKNGYDQHEHDSGGFGNGNPVLKPEHLGKSHKGVGVLTGDIHQYDGEFGAGFMVGIRLGKTAYDLRCKDGSGNMGRLKTVAPREKDLKGKRLSLEVKEYKGHQYVAIVG